jgi:hypothetical protein
MNNEISTTSDLLEDQNLIVFKTVYYDECGRDNPCDDFDGFGRVVSFCSKHVNYEHPDKIAADPDMVPLSYFEHGNCKWGVQGTMTGMPDFCWDGVEVAGVWYPDDVLREEAESRGIKPATAERAELMAQFAAEACQTYTQWCNGEIYNIRVAAYLVRREENGEPYWGEDDYCEDEPVWVDTLGGIYGLKYAEEEADGMANYVRVENDPAR